MKNIIIIVLLGSLFGCGNNKSNDTNSDSSSIKLDTLFQGSNTTKLDSVNNNSNFKQFFEKFSNDSSYRFSRIVFPLNGYNSDAEIDKNDYKWDKDEWNFYNMNDLKHTDDENIISEIISKDTITIWRLYKENSGYDVNYYFKLYDDKWYLDEYLYKNF